MINLENLRRIAFWQLDYLNGSRIRKHYDDIKFILENHGSDAVVARRKSFMDNILRNATTTTSFYSGFKGYKSLEDFPVTNKSIIRNNTEAFFSTIFKSNTLHKVTTSGSTGAPLTIWQDEGKRARHQAENIYFSYLAGYPIGSRLYYLRVWNAINRKSIFERFKLNIVMQDASDLSENNIESFLIKLQNDTSNKSILAFSSTFEAISRYVSGKPHPLNLKVNCLLTISETLPEGAKEILKSAFNCPVISRYSNMENGFLAQQCIEGNNEYHINLASYFIEVLDPERDIPVPAGTLGRIVVTDLFNYAMPLIRYDTGDMGILSEKSACGKTGSVFTKIEGRKVDFLYDTKGNLLSPHIVTNTMWKYSDCVRQFQFIQNDPKDYVIRLNCVKNTFENSGKLIKDLRQFLGSDAKIKIELVDDIPVLSSGKRKKIINNYIKN